MFDLTPPPSIWDAMLAEFGDPTDGEIAMPVPSFATWPAGSTDAD